MSIGSELKSAREAAGLSLEEVASKSKLRPSVVSAIETDDFSQCGGDVYARGHIRVLASIYRIDSTYLLQIFDQQFGISETALEDLAQATSQNLDRGSSLTWKSLSGIAAATLLGAILISNQISGDGGGEVRIASPTESASESSASNGASSSPSASLPAVASADDGVTVQLTVVKSYSWISVTAANGTSLFTGQIEKGEVREFKDPQVLRLVIGNAGAVSVNVNGVDTGIAGGIGEVVRLEFTPDAENSEG